VARGVPGTLPQPVPRLRCSRSQTPRNRLAILRPVLPLDTHVHFHEPSRVEPTLDAAAANFRLLRRRRDDTALGALLLTETAGERVFERLRDEPRVGKWRIERTAENQSLWLHAAAGRLLVVCG